MASISEHVTLSNKIKQFKSNVELKLPYIPIIIMKLIVFYDKKSFVERKTERNTLWFNMRTCCFLFVLYDFSRPF